MLLFGPYAAPRISAGREIQCEIRGLVTVEDWRDCGPIMWPRCRAGTRYAMILAGDLVRAVKTESEADVAELWGMSVWTVGRWRRALGVGRMTLGTETLKRTVTQAAIDRGEIDLNALLESGHRAARGSKRSRAAIDAQRQKMRGIAKPEEWKRRMRRLWTVTELPILRGGAP